MKGYFVTYHSANGLMYGCFDGLDDTNVFLSKEKAINSIVLDDRQFIISKCEGFDYQTGERQHLTYAKINEINIIE
jgi:hypothetical protein